MNPFQYIVRPVGGSSSNFMAQASYREYLDNDALYALIAAKTGSDVATIKTILKGACEVIIEQTIQGHRVAPIEDLIGFMFGCGGSHPESEFAPTYDNLNMQFRGHTGDTGTAYARSIFSAEKIGEQGTVVPEVVRVTDVMVNLQNHYTPGKSMQIELANPDFKLDPQADYHGVFFKATNGVTAEAIDYGLIKGRLIVCTVPTGLTGPQELVITGLIGTALRSGIYPIPLQP